MLKLLSCAQGHYWEQPSEDGADESPALCPVCGQSAEVMPLLELAPSEPALPEITPAGSPPSPPPLHDKDGRPIVAGYEILSDLGKSPTGVRLYRARQVLVNRLVTLKVVFAKEDPGQLAWGSLRGEATALGRFAHPNIVAILEAGERERQLFFNAIEQVNGPTLAEFLSGKPLPYGQAVLLIETLARAVHHAHDKSILHRNLKPASILLQKVESGKGKNEKAGMQSGPAVLLHNESFIPKITDFGLARRPVEGDAGDVDLQGGLPCYLAPEQAWGRAKDIGPATDVYALGAILYELLIGRAPFREATVGETLDAIQSRQPRPFSRLWVRIPRDVEAICRKCLYKPPRRRYPSALALAEDLRRCANGYPVEARAPVILGRFGKLLRRNGRGLALMTIGLVMGVVLFALLRSVDSSPRFDHLRDLNTQRGIALLEADHRQKIASLEAELNQARQNQNFLGDLLVAQRALAAGDKEQARQLLSRASGVGNWEWDYLNGQLQGKNQVSEFRADLPILCMAVNDRYLVAGGGTDSVNGPRGEKGEVSVWDAKTRERLWHWELEAPVRNVSFCTVGLAIVSSQRRRRSGSLQVRYLPTSKPKFSGKLVFPPYQFKDCKPTSVIESQILSNLLVATDDGNLHEMAEHNGQVLLKREVPFRHIRPRGLHARLQQLEAELFALVSPDGGQIVLVSQLRGHNPPIEIPCGPNTTFLDLACNDLSDLAVAAADGTIRLWNVQFLDSKPRVLHGHKGRVNGVSFSSDGQRLASCGPDGTVRIWGVREGIELLTLTGYPSVTNVKFQSPPGGPGRPASAFRQNAGRLALAHGNQVTVILPPPRRAINQK